MPREGLMSQKNIKTISNPKLKLEVLTKEDVQKIHNATLQIIEKVGVRFPSKMRSKKRRLPTNSRLVIHSRICSLMETTSTSAQMAAVWK